MSQVQPEIPAPAVAADSAAPAHHMNAGDAKTPQLDVDYVAALDRRHSSLVCRAYAAISLR